MSLKESYLAIGEANEEILQKAKEEEGTPLFAVLTLEKDFYCNLGFKVIGYKPDIDYDEKACRIAFFGTVQEMLPKDPKEGDGLKLVKNKEKKGKVDRLVDSYSIIVSDLFDKETNLENFMQKEVKIEGCELLGKIEGSFGKSGKVKVGFKEAIDGKIDEAAVVTLNYTKWYH